MNVSMAAVTGLAVTAAFMIAEVNSGADLRLARPARCRAIEPYRRRHPALLVHR